jgi:hypothetical protein
MAVTEASRFDEGAFGRSARAWQRELAEALDRGDHTALRETLRLMRQEMSGEVETLGRAERAPLLDRLTEHARRLLRSAPTELEAVEDELTAERRAWADYRRRYREAFVPAELHPYLESCAVFVAPDALGVQFSGFDKHTGRSAGSRAEAVTLFVRSPDAPVDEEGYVPPNFFTGYDEAAGELVVRRAYRTVLPHGAGTAIIAEHADALVRDRSRLRRIRFDDVQNRPTYTAFVETVEGTPRARPGLGVGVTPLGRTATRVLARLGLAPAAAVPVLDGFGALDLVVEVERG